MRRVAGETEGLIGASPPRVDGLGKVTGRARYLDDLTFPGQLWGRTIRSTIAHARVLRVERDPAFDWSALTWVTAADVPGENVVDLLEDDQPFLAEGVVNHYDEPIALIAGADRERLAEALAHVRVEYEPLPAVFDPVASTAIFRRYRYAREEEKLADAFARAHRIVEGRYEVGRQEQLYLEPNAVCAVPGPEGMTLYGSMQCPFYVQRALERLLGRSGRIRVVQTVTGGGFGGKEDYPSVIAGHACLLARKAGRPVKIVYGRAEDVAATTKRHPAIVTHRTAVDAGGLLLGGEIDLVLDGGAYCTLSPVVLSRAAIHAPGAYRWPCCRVEARVAATNTPPNGAFRGFGAPQALFAIEMQMERIAREIGLDPVELRRRNALREGDVTATGQTLRGSVSALAVLEAAARRAGPRPAAAAGPRVRRGRGFSLVWHGAAFTGAGEVQLRSKAAVELTPAGLRVLAGSTEIGQGTETVFSQIVAEAAGLPLTAVEVAVPDTSRVPDSGPTVASRTTMVVGGTLARAARELSRRLAGWVAARHGTDPANVECREGLFCDGPVVLGSFFAVATGWLEERGPLVVTAEYAHPPGIAWDEEAFHGDAYPAYGWAATAVDVEVDLDTWQTKVRSVVAAADVGRAIHPVLCEGQIEGGIAQALGWALLEEVVHEEGRVANARLASYLVPTARDVPPLVTVLVENPYAHGPFGAKGVGELPMDGPAPAVTAAVLDATGAFVAELPVTPDRLMEAMEGMRRDRLA